MSHYTSTRKISVREFFQVPPKQYEVIRHPTQVRNVQFKEFFQFRCSLPWIATGVGVGALTMMSLWHKSFRLPILATLGTLGIASATYATMVEPRRPVLERVTVWLPSLPAALDGLRIGQLSDFHLDFPHTESNVRWGVQQMLKEQPDIVVLTGDFVSFARAIPTLPELLRPLQAPLGVYAVPGNHDHWEGIDAIRSQLETIGIRFLMNTNRHVLWNGCVFWLAGVDDVWYGHPNLDEALADIPETGFTILLSHSPDYADVVSKHNVAVQISGHTHGGHMRLPLLGWFCVPFHGFRYISGLEQVGNTRLYVTRGLGGMPIRMGCPPEATILTLKRKTSE